MGATPPMSVVESLQHFRWEIRHRYSDTRVSPPKPGMAKLREYREYRSVRANGGMLKTRQNSSNDFCFTIG